MAKPTLADKIAADLPPRPRSRPWWERLDPKLMAELEPVRERWRAGGYDCSQRGLARTISAHLKAAGVLEIGEQGIILWLRAAN